MALPPLRQRGSDLPALARHLLALHGRADQQIDRKALDVLRRHTWPGNVRELENELALASVMAGEGPIRMAHLSQRLRAATKHRPAAPAKTLEAELEVVERRVIVDALARHGGNRTQAAAELGIQRQTLYYRMRRLGLR